MSNIFSLFHSRYRYRERLFSQMISVVILNKGYIGPAPWQTVPIFEAVFIRGGLKEYLSKVACLCTRRLCSPGVIGAHPGRGSIRSVCLSSSAHAEQRRDSFCMAQADTATQPFLSQELLHIGRRHSASGHRLHCFSPGQGSSRRCTASSRRSSSQYQEQRGQLSKSSGLRA